MNDEKISSTDLDNIKLVTQTVVAAATPMLLKAIAATRPGVSLVGELMTTEPARDYRKELWVTTYTRSLISHGPTTAENAASHAVAIFDEVFK